MNRVDVHAHPNHNFTRKITINANYRELPFIYLFVINYKISIFSKNIETETVFIKTEMNN